MEHEDRFDTIEFTRRPKLGETVTIRQGGRSKTLRLVHVQRRVADDGTKKPPILHWRDDDGFVYTAGLKFKWLSLAIGRVDTHASDWSELDSGLRATVARQPQADAPTRTAHGHHRERQRVGASGNPAGPSQAPRAAGHAEPR